MSRSPHALALAACALLFGCASPPVAWEGVAPEDPSPSGPPYLRRYKEAHYRSLGQVLVEGLGHEDLLDQLDGRHVLYLGDHHEDRDLHERMLAVLDVLERSDRRIALGLEAIGEQDELLVRRYLHGETDLDTLRAEIRDRWSGSWLDLDAIDTDFYRAMLEFARERKLPVFGLEPTPRLPLYGRDPKMANRIRRARAHMPDRLLVIVVGHAHLLGSGKLVELVGMPNVAIGARLSRSLRSSYEDAPDRDAQFLRSDNGTLFFNPPPEGL